MSLFKKVAIVGVGLIGGSLALEIKKKGLAKKIIGVSRQRKTITLARKKKIIDVGSQDLRVIRDADFVVLASPVKVILDSAKEVAKVIKQDCLITDVGSTKQEVVRRLEKIFPDYVGSHPLAGSEKRGVQHAGIGLFKDSVCILTPTKNTNPQAFKKIRKFWERIGARVVILSPSQHDKVLSFTSHLAHFAAFSLIQTVPEKYLPFASSGLIDTTRLAASDAQLWEDIALSNRGNIIRAIEALQGNLNKIKAAIRGRKREQLSFLLKSAKAKRESLPNK